MMTFLVLIRELAIDREKSRFPLVNGSYFETKSDGFEIDDFRILSLAGSHDRRSGGDGVGDINLSA